ncbi:MAG: DUF748 domain-containing protein [Desulfocapsaceae bacterium]|nr:DUF748 domain-containing protein [Desulfocapsaceae bacterium]
MPDHFSSIPIEHDTAPRPPKSKRPPREKRPARGEKKRKLPPLNPYVLSVLIVVLLVALYSGAGFALIPVLLQSHLAQYLRQNTDMGLEIGSVQFNPFTFHIHLTDVTVNHEIAAGKEPAFLNAGDIMIAFSPLSALRKTFVCNEFRIRKLTINIIRYNDSRYNFSQALTPSGTGTAGDAIQLPFLYSINNISVTDSSAIFDDRVSGKIHKAEKIELTLPTLANTPYQAQTSVTPAFSAVINGSPVQLTSQAAMPGTAEGDQTRLTFDLHAVDLPLYFGYLPSSLPVQLAKGTADGQMQVSFTPDKDQTKRLTILFQMDMKDIELQTPDRALSASIPAARIEGDLQPFSGDLRLQNIAFHGPDVSLQSTFSEQTLDSLLPTAEKITTKDGAQLARPLFTCTLFTLDNGSLHLARTKEIGSADKTYQALKLSIKNYSNQPQTTTDSPENRCSFTLGGEQAGPAATFSWQGELDEKNTARGTLQLNRFPASFFTSYFTDGKDTDMSGTADMKGSLSIQRNPGEKKRFSIRITEGLVKFSNLGLAEKKNEWLRAESMTLGPIDSKNNSLDIGNIFLQNATLTLSQDKFPGFLDSLLKKDPSCRVHGIDLSGNIILKSGENTKSPLVLSDVSLQANGLEKDTRDKGNVAFTGKAGQSGEIKAKGTVALGPFRASLAVEFSGLQSKELLPWYTDSPFLLEGQARLEGVGRLTYPENVFKGSLRISEARFENKAAKSALAWTSASFQDVTFTKNPFQFSSAAAQIDSPVLNYTQADEKSSVFEQLALFIKGLLPERGPAEKATRGPDLEIKAVTLTKGTLTYRDQRLSPPWQQEISAVAGEIQRLSFPATAEGIAYSFSGTLAGKPLTFEGTADLSATPLAVQSTINMADLPLSMFKEQLPPLVNIDPGKGAFDLALQDTWKGGKENFEAHYFFHGISPTSPSADTALPLALLTDNRDIYEFTLSLKDSSENAPLFAETVKYFKRIVVKSVVAPLLLTNETFSRLAVDDTPDFSDGTGILSEKGRTKLTLYRDLLAAHPRIKLLITGMVDMTTDKKAMEDRLKEAEARRVEKENSRRSQELQKLQSQRQRQGQQKEGIEEKDIPAEELTKYAPILPQTVVVSDKAMRELAAQRSDAAYDFLTSELGIGKERVQRQTPEQTAESANRVGITLRPLAAPPDASPPPNRMPEEKP